LSDTFRQAQSSEAANTNLASFFLTHSNVYSPIRKVLLVTDDLDSSGFDKTLLAAKYWLQPSNMMAFFIWYSRYPHK